MEALSLKLMELIILNKHDFAFMQMRMDEVLHDIADTLLPIMRRKNIELNVSAHPAYVRIEFDLFKTLFLNLIDNAIKYTPPGSVISIRGKKSDGNAQISVEDNGPGIPNEMKPHIFEMFYTGKTTVADSHRSLGLGLALCLSIIEAHDGTLILTDRDPHGCNFTFTLPLSEVTLNE